jgi:amino acid permease
MSAANPDTHRAPADRTTLSWQRTVMHSVIVTLAGAFAAIYLGEPAVGVLAALLAAFAITVGATTPRVKRSDLDQRDPWTLMLRTALVLAASGVVAVMLVVAVALEL